MKISVITVCKNEVKSIEKTLLSVLNQSYKNFEIIVIDGLSTDGTIDIIKKYQDKIAYFKSEKDKGIYNAMNKGIKKATGDIFYFLNANDILSNNNIFEQVINAFLLNPTAEVLFGDFNFMEDGQFHHKVDFEKNYNSYWLFRHNSMCQQALFYKKELFARFGKYDESFKIAGDTERNMNFLIKHYAEGIYLPIVIVDFSMGGISGNLKARKILNKEEKRLYKKYYSKSRFDYLRQKLLKLTKYFMPKVFLFLNKKRYNTEKINVIRV